MLAMYISFFLSAYLFSYALLGVYSWKENHVQKRIDAYFVTNNVSDVSGPEVELPFYKRVFIPIFEDVKRTYKKRMGKEEAYKLEIKLMQAGQPFGLSPIEFKMVQLAFAVIFPVIGLFYGGLLDVPFHVTAGMGAFGLVIAIILPKHYLRVKAQKRSKLAIKELPDTLDLLTISLEAGLGFDAAISQVVAKKKGILAEEFKLCLEEMRLGKTRKEALNGITERLLSEDIRALIVSIIQAEKLGIGMVSVLRVQTEDLRERRKQTAEETAMKAPIKMMFPLVLFIFPTLFIILLGPAILQFIEAF